MKILYLVSDLKEFGGIQRYNATLMEHLKENGVDLKVAEFKRKNFLGKLFVIINCFWQSLIFKPDYFFCSHINFGPIAYLCDKIFKIPYVVFTHGIEVWSKDEKNKKFFDNSKLTVTISEFTKNKLLENYPETKNRIFMLPNSIDTREFYPKNKSEALVKKYNLAGKKVIFTLTRLSSLEKYKGYDRVIEAMPQVLEKIPNVFYVIAGGGDDKKAILDLIKEKKLENHVALAGYLGQEEKIDYYNLADVFVMPSKGEGFGIVFLEALACGKPVIAGNQDGSKDALLNGKTGILVNPEDVGAIAGAIVDILSGNADKRLVDGGFLIKATDEAYGIGVFNKKVIDLINGLQK